MKSKRHKSKESPHQWKVEAARKLARLTPKQRAREYERALNEAEKELGHKLPRYKGKMARPRRLRRAQ